MEADLQTLVDGFRAKGYAFPRDEPGVYLVHENEDELYEEHRAGSHTLNQWFISAEPGKSTPVVYLWDQNRCLYFLDQARALQHYRYSSTEEDWIAVDLASHGMAIDYESGI